MEQFFQGFTKRRLIEMLCSLRLQDANIKIIKAVQNKTFKEFVFRN